MLGCFFLFMATIFSQNKKSYQELLENIQNFEAGQEVQAKQGRKGIRKEIWYNKNGQRLQIVIVGKSADVHYEKSSDHKEIIEHLVDVTAILQEEVIISDDGPKQKLKRIKAEDARYNYSVQELSARNVFMEDVVVPGNRIPEHLPIPQYTLHAETVEMHIVEGNLEVDASHLDAFMGER